MIIKKQITKNNMENTRLDPDYIIEYEKFMSNFKKTEISGEEVGETVMHMAGYFARYNVRMSDSLRAYSLVKAEFQNQVDASTGKATSSAKAETLASATPEAAAYELSRVHVQNIEQYINALKSLQRGVLFEYSNSQ
jgi:hypothetical protein